MISGGVALTMLDILPHDYRCVGTGDHDLLGGADQLIDPEHVVPPLRLAASPFPLLFVVLMGGPHLEVLIVSVQRLIRIR